MKVTLVIDGGIRLSAPLCGQDAMELLDEFIFRLNAEKKTVPEKPPDAKTAFHTNCVLDAKPATNTGYVPETKPATNSGHTPDTKLIAYKCEGCGGFKVLKMPKETAVGDVIPCRCGHETQIKDIKTASGDCANCETRFYNMHLVNGLMELQCRNCKSPVDLIEKADGSLTGSHNVKH